MKKTITEKLYSFDTIEILLKDFMEIIKDFEEDWSDYKNLRIRADEYQYSDYVDYFIVGDREENDKEYKERLREEREKAERLESAKQKKINEALQKQQEKTDRELKKLAELKAKHEKNAL